jgi:type IX secretion system PorP/SprF family membrane protein
MDMSAIKYVKSLLVGCFLLVQWVVQAQDQHFSQYYASPLTLNPALAGSFSGTYRLSLIYRDQWRNALVNPYSTYSAAIDYRTPLRFKRQILKDYLGVGVLFYNDRVPEVGYYQSQINLAAAYHKSLNYRKNEFLTLGLQWGVNQRNIGFGSLFFNDQFNGTDGYSLGTRENFPNNNFAFGDITIGLNYTLAPAKGVGFYAGAGIHHLSQPQVSFYQFEENIDIETDFRLKRKYVVHAGWSIPVGERMQVLPKALLYAQGPHQAINAGSNVRFLVNDIDGAALHLGSWVRAAKDQISTMQLDAVIVMAGFEYQNFLIGMSYDTKTGNWNTAGRRTGAFEFSVAYLGAFQHETVLCPSF